MLEMIVATAGAAGVRIEVMSDVVDIAYPGQPINYTINVSGVTVGKKLYWSLYEDFENTVAGKDRVYGGVIAGSVTVTGSPIVLPKRVMGKTLKGRTLALRVALTQADADNPVTALATSPTITIDQSPAGSATSSVQVPENVYAITLSMSGGGGGGGGGAPSGSFRYYTGGRGGNGETYYDIIYVKPLTTLTVIKGSGAAGGSPGRTGGYGGSTSVANVILPSATVSIGGGGGGGIGNNQTGAAGAAGSPNGGGASGGSGGASSQGTGGTGSTGYATLTWGL